MPLTLELPDTLAESLLAEASRCGISLQDYAVRVLSASKPATISDGATLVAYWQSQGVTGSRPDVEDSLIEARRIREHAQSRGG